MASKRNHLIFAALASLFSAIAWFFGTGLHPIWWLTWLAPLPVLFAALRLSRWTAFGVALAAFAFGGLNVWSYDRIVTPLFITLVILFAPAFLFAWIVSMHRAFIRRGQTFRAAFALPILWSAFEYLLEFRSPHSTWGNLAYSQMDCLPLIQIASITGIWAISFLVFLFSSTIAALFASVSRKRALAITAAAIYAAVFGFGVYRLHSDPASPRVTVALIASDLSGTLYPREPATVALVRAYADHIPALAAQGATVIIIPEKIGRIQGAGLTQADSILEQAARDNHVTVLIGVEHQPNLNEARLYSPDGRLEATYEKHHMLPAFESYLFSGTARLTFTRPSDDGTEGKWGVEICKDMDFPLLARQYSNDGVGLLLVPAWDFIADGWLHDRMAVLRGVESGFSIARVAKQGLLTLTDDRGRVLAERNSSAQLWNTSDPFTTLTGSIPVRNEPTIYARTGDWFAWLDLALAVLLFLPLGRNESY
ncbi:MAG: nitrilase-related carbon-nitrogen hydrolase [Silvibacterium sp.]